jgi:hypothetical protein
MKDFVNSVLHELQTNPEVNSNQLIGLVIESANKSIQTGERYEVIYEQVKRGLIEVNKHVKSNSVKNILDQFRKIDFKPESKLKEFAKIANLGGKLKGIKESTAYSHPMIAYKVDEYLSRINSGTPEFTLYPSFIQDFKQHSVESSVANAVKSVSKIVESNLADFEMLNTIQLMESYNSSGMYANIIPDLTDMLLENTYTSDIINFKYGQTGLPMITGLVNSLKLIESKLDDTFNLGIGDSTTTVRNAIAPAIKSSKTSVLTYMDNRFIRVTESNNLDGSEVEVFVKKGGYSISEIDPNWVKENHSDFYSFCESFAYLGFKEMGLYEGIETSSIRGFKLGLVPNQNKELDLYLNESKVQNVHNINLTEALALVDDRTKRAVKTVFENIRSVFNFEFIKNIKNDITLAESTVFNLGKNYFLCQKPNVAERIWDPVDESKLYEHFATNFNYDISSIFKTKVNESFKNKEAIEFRKREILESVEKLEATVKKLDVTINSDDVDISDISRLEELKESIEGTIESLKLEYIDTDLLKRRVNEKKKIDQDGDGDNDWDDVKIARMKASAEAAKSKKKKEKKLNEEAEGFGLSSEGQVTGSTQVYYLSGTEVPMGDKAKLKLSKDGSGSPMMHSEGVYVVEIIEALPEFPFGPGEAWIHQAKKVDGDNKWYLTSSEGAGE